MSLVHSDAVGVSVPTELEAETRCVNAHDRCFLGAPCPYCETVCFRDSRGRFAAAPTPATIQEER